MTGPRIGEMCAGYAGLSMAVEQVLGGELAWVADNDPGASAILAHRFPSVKNLGDITTIDWATVEPVDILAGGYPCQPASDAGLRKGTDDERWIWPHFIPAIRVLRPSLILLENVRGHLGRGFDAVLGDLAALGFDAEWCLASAAGVGACHRRERVFVLAWPAAEDPYRPVGGERRLPGPGQAAGGGAWANARRSGGTSAPADTAGPRWGRSEDAGADRGDASPRPRGSQPERGGGSTAADAVRGGRDRRPRVQERGPAWGVAATWHRPGAFGRYEAAVRQWERTFGRRAPTPVEPGRGGKPRLAPAFAEWMMGLPDGWVTGVPGLSRNDQLHAIGNGVVPVAGAAALRVLLERAPEAVRSLLARTGTEKAA